MKLIPTLAVLCALVLTPALSADTFEGKVTLKITSSSPKEKSQAIEMSVKAGFMRTDIATQRGAASMIMDFQKGQMLILMAQQRMYMVKDLPEPGGAAAASIGQAKTPSASSLQETGVKETILGYECTKYVVNGAEGTSEIWVTSQLGSFAGLFRGAGPGRPQQPPAQWESAIKERNFFPMRVITTSAGKETFRLEVTAVQKTSLPDSLFAAPEGWQKLDLGAMMGGAMPGGFPGARPSGNTN